MEKLTWVGEETSFREASNKVPHLNHEQEAFCCEKQSVLAQGPACLMCACDNDTSFISTPSKSRTSGPPPVFLFVYVLMSEAIIEKKSIWSSNFMTDTSRSCSIWWFASGFVSGNTIVLWKLLKASDLEVIRGAQWEGDCIVFYPVDIQASRGEIDTFYSVWNWGNCDQDRTFWSPKSS